MAIKVLKSLEAVLELDVLQMVLAVFGGSVKLFYSGNKLRSESSYCSDCLRSSMLRSLTRRNHNFLSALAVAVYICNTSSLIKF